MRLFKKWETNISSSQKSRLGLANCKVKDIGLDTAQEEVPGEFEKVFRDNFGDLLA